MDSLENMRHQANIDQAMRTRPDAQRIPPTPVTARTIAGHAIATSTDDVLVEWVKYGERFVRWMPKAQVTKVEG